ncbi:MAG: FeoA family protein [Candidatus Thermoplasmatota archaeon]|nr:FeoA family protein [Candidatus Thermoplasmatota archaeon]
MEITLLDIKPEQRAKILRLEGGYGAQRKLRTLGIREGKLVKLVTRHPIGGPLVIEIDERAIITIGRGMASKIIVEVMK